ncbi:MAG: GlmU family protein [Sphingobacteriaceae bacterium]|nr:GlmU family protein [Sphingobacteriaceae bacterium]
MEFVLFDSERKWKEFLPLTYTRPIADIRFGILTIREKWEKYLKLKCRVYSQTYLSNKFPFPQTDSGIFISSNICPNDALVKEIKKLNKNEALFQNQTLIAFNGNIENINRSNKLIQKQFKGTLLYLENICDIFRKNGEAIQEDFKFLTKGKKSAPIKSSVKIIGKRSQVFFEKGVVAEACTINTHSGPVYVAKEAEIMEGSAIRGPFYLGEHSALKLNTKIYGPTSIGPHSKIGGEVNNCVIFGYTNKAHDGFIGNSVIGEWCNLGADTNSSNLKNNYANVKIFNYLNEKMTDTGLQFCGLIMGDHSKTGINTMLNTGTVVGVGANIFGGGFPPTHIPSFYWGGADESETYKPEKLFETAEKVFARRGLKFNETEKELLTHIFSLTTKYRNY